MSTSKESNGNLSVTTSSSHSIPISSSNLSSNPASSSLLNLPYEVLNTLSTYLEPVDILHGLCETNPQLYSMFKSERYWQQRLAHEYPEIYSKIAARHSSSESEDPLFWRKYAYRCEGVRENFRLNRMVSTTWSSFIVDGYYEPDDGDEDEETSGIVDISCITFCHSGNVLALGDSTKYEVLYWVTRGHDRPPYAGPPENLRHLHEDVICSLKGLDHRLSSGSCDGTIAVIDLQKPIKELARLRSTDRVFSHAWVPGKLVAGIGNGGFEIFDERSGLQPVLIKDPVFEPVEMFDGMEVEIDDDRIVVLGWEHDARTIKTFDIRTGTMLASAAIPGIVMPQPAGHWGQRIRYKAATHLHEGQLYVGAEQGKIFQYDAKTLELVKDLSGPLGHTRHIAGIHCTGSQMISVSRAGRTKPEYIYRTVVHDLSEGYPLLWQRDIPAFTAAISAMDFCDERCSLAVALTNQVQLWRPEPRNRKNGNAVDARRASAGAAYMHAPD